VAVTGVGVATATAGIGGGAAAADIGDGGAAGGDNLAKLTATRRGGPAVEMSRPVTEWDNYYISKHSLLSRAALKGQDASAKTHWGRW
jgi:hypothetical protein